MGDFRKWLPTWTVLSQRDNGQNRGDGGGGVGENSSWTELSSLGPELSREHSNTSPVWKPVWYTGWHTGVLICAATALVVLFINVGLTIYAVANAGYEMEGGTVMLYPGGSCDRSKTIGTWLHLGINVLSTLLLSSSNYTQQCLAAPTRSEIDSAHARRRWMDIGVPSVRNLFRIKLERTFLWIAIGLTSIPLHLLYNSAVYTSLTANSYAVAIVATNDAKPGGYLDMLDGLEDSQEFLKWRDGALFRDVVERYINRARIYQYLVPSDCMERYNRDFVSDRSNLFLVVRNSSTSTYNATLLDMFGVSGGEPMASNWICRNNLAPRDSPCDPNKLVENVKGGHPWRMELTRGEVEISGCLSEKTDENCTVQFTLQIMIIVICCNFVKACCMIMAVVRTREPTLVTLGDAVDSFLRVPDPTTVGMCFSDRRFVILEWRRGRSIGARPWKQEGVQRWWRSVSETRWLICNLFCLITIIAAGILLRMGIRRDASYGSTSLKSMWNRGLGKVNSVSLVTLTFRNITEATLLANLPQTILSFLYLTYNSLFTCMLLGHEWSLFAHHHRTLRVTSPRPGQRSTYWLQVPYTYAIPLMTLSGLLHWLTSQSIFLARVDVFDELGESISKTISGVGYSCIATIFALTLGILALVAATGIGSRSFAAEIVTVGSCSAAISAACHAWGEDTERIVGRKIRWGDVGFVRSQMARHLTFSSEEGVKVGKPVVGEVYAGIGEKGE
ncbi:unnamed protein product [Tuber aestivum]|uniref:DUF6536 domain-containing protein n=1 Tax=Tuber aestivum TaxID=59557 RepID=A0A292Q8T5_9PEZI|nr:unnamed protein product [Tuber aestivum]